MLQFVFLLLPFVTRICSAFPSLYKPSRSPSCHCLSRLAIVLDKDPSFSDFVLHSSKCGKIIAACIAKAFSLFSIRLFSVLFMRGIMARPYMAIASGSPGLSLLESRSFFC